MLGIPGGPFKMGSDAGEGYPDEEPQHVVELSAYCIDRTEVTNAEYRQCVADGACGPLDLGGPVFPLPDDYDTNRTYDQYPAANVRWTDALAYCEWAGKRLPTEAEWEKGARGGCEVVQPESCGPEDERVYPWGDAPPTCALTIAGRHEPCRRGPEDVAARPAGASPYGLLGMAGNATEWVADWYDDAYYWTCATGCADPEGPATGTSHVRRGGGWESSWRMIRVAYRGPPAPDDPVGFRCAVSLP